MFFDKSNSTGTFFDKIDYSYKRACS